MARRTRGSPVFREFKSLGEKIKSRRRFWGVGAAQTVYHVLWSVCGEEGSGNGSRGVVIGKDDLMRL